VLQPLPELDGAPRRAGSPGLNVWTAATVLLALLALLLAVLLALVL
jgi:hypothetical protein